MCVSVQPRFLIYVSEMKLIGAFQLALVAYLLPR